MEDISLTKQDFVTALKELNVRFDVVDQRLTSIDGRFDGVEGRLTSIIDSRFDEMGLMVKHGFDAMDQRFDQIEQRLDDVEERSEIQSHQNRFLAKRITVLESKQPA